MPRTNRSIRPGPHDTAAGLSRVTPPSDSYPNQAPAYHLCQTALSVPRTKVSSRPVLQLAAAGVDPAARQQPRSSNVTGLTVSTRVWVALPRLLAAVRRMVRRPGVPAAGVPVIEAVPLPLSLKVRPTGSAPVSLSTGNG